MHRPLASLRFSLPTVSLILPLLALGPDAASAHTATPDLFSHLQQLEQSGALSPAQAWQARGQALLAPEQLPAELARLPRPAPQCLTPMLLELRQHLDALDPITLARLTQVPIPSPVPTVGSVVSKSLPITVYYRLEGQAGQAADVLAQAEESWLREVDGLGFPEPLDSPASENGTLDLYITDEDNSGGGAYTVPLDIDTDPSDNRQTCRTYIKLYEGLSDELMPVYVAHEMNHAMQSALDCWEIPSLWEITATFMEDMVYDGVNDYYYYIPYFQLAPEQSLFYFSSTDAAWLYYPYGANIFMHFLNEGMGQGNGLIAADLWERAVQPNQDNSVDALDALESLALSQGWQGADEALARFALWRYFAGPDDDGKHFAEGSSWSEGGDVRLALWDEATKDALPAEGDIDGIYDLGAAYLRIDTHGSQKVLDVTLEADGSARWMLVASRLREGKPSEDLILSEKADTGKVQGELSLEGADQVVLGFVNVGRKDYSPEGFGTGEAAVAAGGHFRLELKDGTGCGCTHPGGRMPLSGGLLLLLGTACLRRRRQG